ncbi:MAG: hypothetical protein MI810_13765 [Flavobacteriales bacterium]|jgi:PBP1b-binding outer membrane lipoprotein LpoB|nr:hypothetical protein [Flavobacteriales bacterium]
MRVILFLLAAMLIIASCSQNSETEKEEAKKETQKETKKILPIYYVNA